MAKNAKIIGPFECPVCCLRGYDRDEQRGNLGADNRVSSIICGRISETYRPDGEPHELFRIAHKLSASMRLVIADLISTTEVEEDTFRITKIDLGDQPIEGQRAAAAVAQMIDPSVLATVRVNLACGEYAFETIELSGDPDDLKVAETAPKGDSNDPSLRPYFDRISATLAKALRDLVNNGFVVAGHDLESSMRHITLRKGVGNRGIRAQVSWIA